jgi:hypothetical protein
VTRPAWRARRLLDVNAAYEDVLARGFATATFAGQPEAETLQCRNEMDRTNWLGLVIKCQFAIQALAGGAPIDPPIRCTSNRMYAVTYDDALARMLVLLGQVGAAQANWWRLKDAVRAAQTGEALNALDLTQGWP